LAATPAWGGARSIFINKPLLAAEGKLGTLGHETAHILQGDHFWRARDVMGKDGLAVTLPKQDAISNIVINEATANEFKPGYMRRILNAVTNATGLGIDYLKSGIEIQARMQEALIEGYPKWDRMPQNNTDFYFAMKSLGFKLTPELRKVMDAHPDKDELEKAFPKSKSRFSSNSQFVNDIEQVQANLTKEGQASFWNYAMPRLYADLIEMYGDKHGRERMGMGPNETHAFRASHENDIQNISRQKWIYNTTKDAGDYACIRLDALSAAEAEQLVKSLDNQYIGIKTKDDPAPATSRWLFVTGEQGMKNLKSCLDQAPAQTVQPVLVAEASQAVVRKAAI
jgi:hypothetical protein